MEFVLMLFIFAVLYSVAYVALNRPKLLAVFDVLYLRFYCRIYSLVSRP